MLEREDKVVSWCSKGEPTPKAEQRQMTLKSNPWKKLGFHDKTFWDWMDLLLVPLFILGGTVFFNRAATVREENFNLAVKEREQYFNLERKKQEVVQNYLSKMTELISSGQLIDPKNLAFGRTSTAAKALTQSALRDVDGDRWRKRQILEFLYDAELVTTSSETELSDTESKPIIDMAGIDLSEANLASLSLGPPERELRINLSLANLSEADLNHSSLSRAQLVRTQLIKSNLEAANLEAANLKGANLKGANLKGANLAEADLSYADLTDAELQGANLSGNIDRSKLSDAKLNGANLTGAHLRNANLTNAHLNGADLTRADLTGANLKTAEILGTIFCQTTMPEGTVESGDCPEQVK